MRIGYIRQVPTDIPTEDEIESLAIAQQQIENGEFFMADEIDWDNLDKMDLGNR